MYTPTLIYGSGAQGSKSVEIISNVNPNTLPLPDRPGTGFVQLHKSKTGLTYHYTFYRLYRPSISCIK